MSPEVWSNFIISLKIMGQGMQGVFIVIILISLIVAALGRMTRQPDAVEETPDQGER